VLALDEGLGAGRRLSGRPPARRPHAEQDPRRRRAARARRRRSGPCLGDAAFDAIDLVLWQADEIETIERRSDELAAAMGAPSERLLAWCTALACMAALELAATADAQASASTPLSPSRLGHRSNPLDV
jgi:hypothetical protein